MATSSFLLIIGCELLLLSAILGQQGSRLVSDLCLGCICEAISNCNRSLGCVGKVCGPFRITEPYWTDAGKPVIYADNETNPGAFERCVKEPYCAARTVQGYMAMYGQDCNKDGVTNCFDYASIHQLGGFGCGKGVLDRNYETKFLTCQNLISQISGGKPL